MSATVTPNYSHGRRKFGRPPKVHHWDIACDECPGVNLRPSRFWEPKKRLLEIAAEHNRVAHPAPRHRRVEPNGKTGLLLRKS